LTAAAIDPVPITDERYIYVMLRDGSVPSGKEIAAFVDDGVYFDADPIFAPPLSDLKRDEPLDTLTVVWDLDRPAILARWMTKAECHQIIEEVNDALQESEGPNIWSASDVTGAVQLLFDEETMTEDSWFMLDSLEAYIARSHNGLVYAPGDGLFDSALQPIYRRPPK
jgi:hypothetical protein